MYLLLVLYVYLKVIFLLNVFLFLNVVCLNVFDFYKYIYECRIKNRGFLFKYFYIKWYFMLMYINIYKKNSFVV